MHSNLKAEDVAPVIRASITTQYMYNPRQIYHRQPYEAVLIHTTKRDL